MSAESERQTLADRLRIAREYIGLSQQQVAEQTGLSRAALSAIETGRRKVESTELAALARTYKSSVGYLIGEDAETDDTVAMLTRTAQDLTDSDKEEVLRFARFLKQYGAARGATGRADDRPEQR